MIPGHTIQAARGRGLGSHDIPSFPGSVNVTEQWLIDKILEVIALPPGDLFGVWSYS